MSKVKDYSKTKTACYLGFVTQAIVANFPPLLFMAFHREYELPIASLALIPAVFYIVQLVTDLLCAKFKNIDYRKSIIVSEVTSALGLIGLAFVPALFALLALAGDMGGTLGPSFVGLGTEFTGEGIQGGLLALVFPVLLVVSLLLIRRAS